MTSHRRSSKTVRRTSSPSISSGKSGSTAGGVSAKSSSKKYNFHPDYSKAVVLDDPNRANRRITSGKLQQQHHSRRHPFEDDDEYWEKKYRIVNYRKKYPNDFDENLFKTLYDWITNGDKDDLGDGQGENILFNNDKERNRQQNLKLSNSMQNVRSLSQNTSKQNTPRDIPRSKSSELFNQVRSSGNNGNVFDEFRVGNGPGKQRNGLKSAQIRVVERKRSISTGRKNY